MRYSFWIKHTKIVIDTFYNSPNGQDDENLNLIAKRKCDDERENSKSNSTTAAAPINTKKLLQIPPKKAIAEELEGFMKNKLFTKISKLKNHCIVGCKWLFKCKIDANDQMEYYKTSLVA